MKIKKAMRPPKKGETSQDSTMLLMLLQLTTSTPPATMPKPTMLPTMECVEDTGKPVKVAKSTHSPADKRAANMPMASRLGSPMASGGTMPRQMVSVTSEPKKTAPIKLSPAAIKTAWRTVMARAPTEGAMELATSLAPRLKAIKKPAAMEA